MHPGPAGSRFLLTCNKVGEEERICNQKQEMNMKYSMQILLEAGPI